MEQDFVVDNSVVMTWCFKDETSRYADRILDKLAGARGHVPCIWPLEVCNVLLAAERKKRLYEADSTYFVGLLSELPIIVEQEQPEKMMGKLMLLGRKCDLSSYDASYLDLAMRKGLPIATLDKKVLSAAKQTKVPVLR